MNGNRLAVLVSGNGSNLQAIIDEIKRGTLPATIGVVISNVKTAFALERAKKAGVTSLVIEEKERSLLEERLIHAFQEYQIDWIVLAGFMRILSPGLVQRYQNRILNIHPSLLPLFPGKDAILQAWQAGVKETGCTVHWVDEGVDTGAVIGQKKVEIRKNDTLETLTERVHQAEHELYPAVLREIVTGNKK